jgi:hypothetical protein
VYAPLLLAESMRIQHCITCPTQPVFRLRGAGARQHRMTAALVEPPAVLSSFTQPSGCRSCECACCASSHGTTIEDVAMTRNGQCNEKTRYCQESQWPKIRSGCSQQQRARARRVARRHHVVHGSVDQRA